MAKSGERGHSQTFNQKIESNNGEMQAGTFQVMLTGRRWGRCLPLNLLRWAEGRSSGLEGSWWYCFLLPFPLSQLRENYLGQREGRNSSTSNFKGNKEVGTSSRPGSWGSMRLCKHLPCKVKMKPGRLMMWSIEMQVGSFRVTRVVRDGSLDIMVCLWLPFWCCFPPFPSPAQPCITGAPLRDQILSNLWTLSRLFFCLECPSLHHWALTDVF